MAAHWHCRRASLLTASVQSRIHSYLFLTFRVRSMDLPIFLCVSLIFSAGYLFLQKPKYVDMFKEAYKMEMFFKIRKRSCKLFLLKMSPIPWLIVYYRFIYLWNLFAITVIVTIYCTDCFYCNLMGVHSCQHY